MLPDLIEVSPPRGQKESKVVLPGSKSLTNRALILAALAAAPVTLRGALWSEDTKAMVECLERLGREAEALTWFRTIAQRSTHELVYLAPARLRESEIAVALRDGSGAASAFDAAARLWSNAAPLTRERIAQTANHLRRSGIDIPTDTSRDR